MQRKSKPGLLSEMTWSETLRSEGIQCISGARQVTERCSAPGFIFAPFDCLWKVSCDTVCPRVFRQL